MHIYKTEEWQGGDGRWLVNDVSDLSGISSKWWVAAHVLGISYEDFVRLLVNKFHAQCSYRAAANVLIFTFDSQTDARKYKNYVNKVARDKHFMV